VRQSSAAVLILILAVTSGACAARSGGGVPRPRPFPGAALPPTATPEQPAVPPATDPAPARADAAPVMQVVDTALTFLGVPYRNGGTDPSGFDCSGFVQYVFSRLGIALPREVRDQYRVGQEIKLADVKAGDLLFFETVSRGASHVGMAIGPGQFVHAPSSRGVVRVERYGAQYWASRFVGARRVAGPTASASGGLPGSSRSSR
jgi:cell wall-associated NlpC family hydrolase